MREESAFQGGDGYLLFGTPELAAATVTRIADQTFHPAAGPIEDPIYAEPDFSADFFATVRAAMEELVEDRRLRGAARRLRTGAARSHRLAAVGAAERRDAGSAARIRHPRELRAIPNNAILQQLGWCANTLQGMGAAAARHPGNLRRDAREQPPLPPRAGFRGARAGAFRYRGAARRVATLDPGTWLDRAAHTRRPGRRAALVAVARALERLDIWAAAQSMFRRIQADHLALRVAWPEAPHMGRARSCCTRCVSR